MVRHIVLFKLKDEVPADEKWAAMNRFKEAIEALPAKIPTIRKIEVGLNLNPAETWHVALYSEFDTLDELRVFDTTYVTDTRSDILKQVCRQLGCEEAQLRELTAYKDATNAAAGFLFRYGDDQYRYSYEDQALRRV